MRRNAQRTLYIPGIIRFEKTKQKKLLYFRPAYIEKPKFVTSVPNSPTPETAKIEIQSMISLFTVSAKPARCESDKDCLKGQAKCIRRECRCTNKYAFGDGKAKCESRYISFMTNNFPLFLKGPKRLF